MGRIEIKIIVGLLVIIILLLLGVILTQTNKSDKSTGNTKSIPVTASTVTDSEKTVDEKLTNFVEAMFEESNYKYHDIWYGINTISISLMPPKDTTSTLYLHYSTSDD